MHTSQQYLQVFKVLESIVNSYPVRDEVLESIILEFHPSLLPPEGVGDGASGRLATETGR